MPLAFPAPSRAACAALVAALLAACSGSGFSGALPPSPDEADASTSTVESPTGADGGSSLTCKSSRADCNGRATDGCEIDTSSNPKHCGACGKACGADQVCAKGKCAASCPSGLEQCGGACVDVQTSVDHCGQCNKACPTASDGTATCAAASCGLECNLGFSPCATGCCSKPPPPPVQPGATLSAGGNHACTVTTTGGMKCWGSNGSGKLGDGTLADRKTATQVSGLTSGVLAVGAGNIHTCALLSTGEVRCWGANDSGQLGTGDNTASKVPTTVASLASGALALAVGRDHSCAIVAGGAVKCWGANERGQVGDGTKSTAFAPVAVSGLTGPAIAIACGGAHSCALLEDASVACWGAGDMGQIGDGTNGDALGATKVTSLPAGTVAITAGVAHTCSRTATQVSCWGDNASGQLGDGTTSSRTVPSGVTGLTGATQIDAGTYHVCAVDGAGGVVCWGLGSSGQLGDGVASSSTEPVQVIAISSLAAAEVAGGGGFSCMRAVGGPVRCWGSNSRGQLGNNSQTTTATPVAVQGL